jgi:putative membrane protein
VAVAVVIPLVAATVLVWATTGRPQNLDLVQVAVVNEDAIIQKPQPMAAGRALAAALTQPGQGQDTYLDWTLADADDAAQGLRDGDYYAVLTIPQDFSKAILSTGTDAPESGRLQLVSNAAASTTVPFISEAVASAAATSLGQQATEGYLGQVYDGFNQVASSAGTASSSAVQLADGTGQVASGADELAGGAGQLAGGLAELATGASELSDGTARVDSGATDLAAGARELARGARRLDAGAGTLARDSRTLAKGEARLARSSRTLAGKQRALARGARQAATGAGELARANRGLAVGQRLLARDLVRLSDDCEAAGGSAPFCRRVGRAARGGDLLERAAARVGDLSARVARGDARLATDAGRLAAGGARLAAGAERLATGASALAAGSGRLDGAAGRLADGAAGVSAGARSLASGVAETDAAAGRLAAGADSSAAAGSELASASGQLASGATSADEGAQQLSDGLAELAAGVPTYSKKQQQALTPVVSEPVSLASTVEHRDDGNGWLLAVVLGVVLWLAALLGVLRRDPAEALRHAGEPVPSRRLVLLPLGPAVGIAVVQGLACLAALPLLGVGVAGPVALALLTLLAAVTFTLVGLALRWALGAGGIVLFVLLLLLQAAALGNVLPIETAPAPLPLIHGLLPLPAYVDAASQLASGGAVGSPTGSVTVLVAWSLVGALAALLVLRHRRVVPTPTVAATPA